MVQSVHDWNERNIREFRESGGKIAQFGDAPVLLLTHTGAKSGVRRTNPLVYLPEGDVMYVFASKGGASTNPDWYHNLLANPVATVEVGTETFEIEAREVTGEERDRIFSRQSELWPQFAQYQRNTSRRIPVIALRRRA
jgi:deazaflavin-dependent oxidoreductase (nitroreductase family)